MSSENAYDVYDCQGNPLPKPLQEYRESDFLTGSIIIAKSGRMYTKYQTGWRHGNSVGDIPYEMLNVRAIYDVTKTKYPPARRISLRDPIVLFILASLLIGGICTWVFLIM